MTKGRSGKARCALVCDLQERRRSGSHPYGDFCTLPSIALPVPTSTQYVLPDALCDAVIEYPAADAAEAEIEMPVLVVKDPVAIEAGP